MPDESSGEEIETSTGKSLSQWFALLSESGAVKLSDLIKWLQTEYAMVYRTAHKLTHLYLKNREENAPKVRYTSSGRSGTVHYISKEASFDLWYEFAGGNALAIINVPTPEQWEAQTKTPLSRRQSILTFIGEQVVKDQTLESGSFTIEDDFLTIYSRKSH